MSEPLKNQIEALLFSAGGKMHVEELAKITKSKIDQIKEALVQLKQDYDDRDSSLMLASEGDSWKISVKESYLNLVRNIVSETELSKTVMETLAVIAFKYPIRQSDLSKIRTNKAYDHLRDLENMGYITRQKHGRTNLIKLTQKFFEYFDLREEQLKDKFQDFRSIADAIENKEKEIEELKVKQKEEAEGEKTVEEKEEAIQNQIDSLEEYDSPESVTEIMEDEKEKLGNLDVVDEPPEEELVKDRKRIEEVQHKEEEKQKQKEKHEEHTFEGPGIQMTEEMEKVVDQKVEDILNPKTEEEEKKEEKSESKEEIKEEAEPEPKDLLEAAMHASKKQKDQDQEKKEEKEKDDVSS